MSNRQLLANALLDFAKNTQQLEAVNEKTHCLVLAGPGSGKTKTLTTAIARTLLEDVSEPRGIACITYNNECALELEARLARLGVEPSDRVFIGTVHSFALSQVISPYARCVLPELTGPFGVATASDCREAVRAAHAEVLDDSTDPHERWRFAEHKRRRQVDRTRPIWRGRNPEIANFIEAYERRLRQKNLVDFDDMPLLAFRMVQAHEWIRRAIHARFPCIFVDEYQDLGYALHALVLKLCFESDIRLFAVGDPDQSIYAFNDANPNLLRSLADRPDVHTVKLRLNYRCGTKIISASMAALAEERDYVAPEGTEEGSVLFLPVDGAISAQAGHIASKLIPKLINQGNSLQDIAVLYRNADQGNIIASAVQASGLPIVRADRRALVRRNSRLSRFVEACASWVAGGWKDAHPPFRQLANDACSLVFGASASKGEREQIQLELINFLHASIDIEHTANSWLTILQTQIIDK